VQPQHQAQGIRELGLKGLHARPAFVVYVGYKRHCYARLEHARKNLGAVNLQLGVVEVAVGINKAHEGAN
jgi:hypothetical protein